MKTEDKITQVYQDAFKDFSAVAPASVQTGALNQLGRKSLLTLDPTRLNVFYMALLSGVIAWSILGTGSDELAVKNTEPNLLQTANSTNTADLINNDETTASFYEESNQEENDLTAKSNEGNKPKTSKNLTNVVKTNRITSAATNDGLASLTADELEPFITEELELVTEMNPQENAADAVIIETIKPSLKDEIEKAIMPVSLEGAKIQNPKEFLKHLYFDRNNKVTLTVIK